MSESARQFFNINRVLGNTALRWQQLPSTVTAVSPDNAQRERLNRSVISGVAQLPAGDKAIIRVLASVTPTKRAGASARLPDNELRWFYNSSSELITGKVPAVLDLYQGMPVSVRHNVATTLGVANGSVARIRRIVFPIDTTGAEPLVPVRTYIDGVLCVVHLARQLPSYVEIQITEGKSARARLAEGSDLGCFPLTPMRVSFEAQFGKKTTSGATMQAKRPFTMIQLPMTCGHCVTGHKVQGRSLHGGILVVSLNGKPAVPRQWLYVQLSRATSVDGVYLCEPISAKMLERSKPSPEPSSCLTKPD
jgi:hypothetical protein